MKISYFLSFSLIILTGLSSFAQVVSVGNTKMNIVYIGIDNAITIAVENHDCDELIVECSGCEIIKTGDCQYNVRANNDGLVDIKVSVANSDTIYEKCTLPFRAKRIPDPVAQVARKSGGFVPADEFKVQVGVFAVLLNFDICAYYKVLEYTSSIKKVRKKYFEIIDTSKKASFTDKMKSTFQKVSEGDIVMFYDIKVMSPDGTIKDLSPILFRITEKPKVKKKDKSNRFE